MSESDFDRLQLASSRRSCRPDPAMADARPRYKSYGERKIARLLALCGLPFVYEKPTAVRDGGKTKIWYPDFYLRCGLYIEYFGVDGEKAYADRTRHKLKVYGENGINVVAVYPRDLDGQWEARLLGRIDRTLDQMLSNYRACVQQGMPLHASETSERVIAGLAGQYLELR